MLRYQQQFDFFDLDKLNRSIRFINLSNDTTSDLGKVLKRIVAEVEAHNAGLIFVDSLRSPVLENTASRRPPSACKCLLKTSAC